MYKNYLLSIFSGLLLALAWPTYGFSLFVFIGFVPLLIAEFSIRNSNNKHQNFHTFFASYLAFLTWNTITTWWIWNSTIVGAIFALVVNSLLMTLVFYLYHLVAKRKNLRFSLIFLAAIWISFEKFHLNWDFSWPWLNLGNVFSDSYKWIQWYEYTGIFGGSLWIWIVNISIFKAVLHFQENNNFKNLIKALLLPVSIVVLGIFSSLYLYQNYQEKGKSFTAIVLQPNINPYTEKYKQTTDRVADDIIALSNNKMDNNVSYILAPETAFSKNTTLKDFYKTNAYKKITDYLSKYPNSSLLTGIDQYEIFSSTIPKSPTANSFTNTDKVWYEHYNAAIYLANNQAPKIYHKSKLVVGVEHFPFRSVLQPLLGDVMINLGGSISTNTPQKEVSVFTHPNKLLTAAPIICYESIYGEFVGNYVKKGANFFAIITNDSWWGNTQGHKQLLSYARLRAIEHRRAIARSANSGISAFINQKGDIIKQLGYEKKGVLKSEIQANNTLTFYNEHGDYIARIAMFISVLFFLIGMVVPIKKEDL